MARSHVIQDGSGFPVAVVRGGRVNGDRTFTRDLRWSAVEFLREPLPGWTIDEVDWRACYENIYLMALRVREQRQRTEWDGEYYVVLNAMNNAD